MQDYMEQIDCDHPLYANVVHKKVNEKFNKPFSNATNLIARMKDSCKKNSTIVMIGPWPLDSMLSNNWWHSTHPVKNFPEYVTMAGIEMDLVEDYHALMFKECPTSVYIQKGLASALTEACKAKAWEVPNTHTGKMEKKSI